MQALSQGANWLTGASLSSLRELVEACIPSVKSVAKAWVETACSAKRIDANLPVAAEEILAGPTALLRYLRALSDVLESAERDGVPKLPGPTRVNSQGQVCVPVLPVRRLYDRLTFLGLHAEVWRRVGADPSQLFTSTWRANNAIAGVAGVLGAGNVSSIPATDTLYKIFHDRKAVLLKLNPVNDYLEPIFRTALKPLVDANLLRILCGGADVGEAILQDPAIASVHITGSHVTHDIIVWGRDSEEQNKRKHDRSPRITKPVTSELGNVSPWIVVPGKYSERQLLSQAQHIAASITNNASFNCLATKMIVTSRHWSQRERFLNMLDSILGQVPPRFAYYPGARERFEKATQGTISAPADNYLPWTVLRGVNRGDNPHLFEEESFVCVCAETQLEGAEPRIFLESAVDFVNEELFGTLCASLTIPSDFYRNHLKGIDLALAKLRYGTVSVNQWSGVSYGLMTPPWGGYPGASIESPVSGIGHVHNTFCISEIDKSVLWGPLVNFPKPVWFPTNQTAHKTSWALVDLYASPALLKLPKLFYHALLG